MKNAPRTVRTSTLCSLLLACLLLNGCAYNFYKENAIVGPRIDAPPPGKTLVNFHKPSGGQFTVPVFKDNGDLVGALSGSCEFQYVCEPGEHAFIGFGDTPLQFKGWINEGGDVVGSIAVLKATVDADKIYDVVVDASIGWTMPAIYFSPVAKGSERRAEVPKYERREKSVTSGLQKTPNFDKYHQKQQSRIVGIKSDFLGGSKSDKVRYLNREDSR